MHFVYRYAFITYDSVESAEKAIKQASARVASHWNVFLTIICLIQMDNGFLAKTRIRVSFARKQPSLTDTPEEPSTESVWNMGEFNALLVFSHCDCLCMVL